MLANCFRHGVLSLALVSSAPAYPQAPPVQEALPPTLPLRRDAPATPSGRPWLAATAALALLALGGTVLVGRQRRWNWLQPGKSRAHAGRELVRLSSQALTAQASLHAVRWNDEELLLACTGQQVTLIARRSVFAAQEDGR